MDKRTVLAIVLSAVILIGYYGFFYKPPVPQPANVATPTTPSTDATETTPQAAAASPTDPETLPISPEGSPPPPVQVSDINTPLVQAKIISKGGFPYQWWLQKFFQQADDQGDHIDLLKGSEANPALGLLLFPGKSAYFPHLSLGATGSDTVEYSGRLGELALVQSLKLGQPPYSVEVTLKIKNMGSGGLEIAPGIRMGMPQVPGAEKKKGGFLGAGSASPLITPLYRMENSVERQNKYDKLGVHQEQVGEISWVGLEDQYFLRAILARSVTAQNRVVYGRKGDYVYSDFQYPTANLAAGAEREFQFTLYLGPKDPTYLKPFAGANLDSAIDYGIFGFVARPLLWLMKFFHSFLKNWGLAIILLTIAIKLALHPLTKKSMASMKGMQELQPQLKAMREKYKDDKERLNAETIALFRRHKVNPAGGCLPMLLQMPIYIALYKVLYNATELYHAPFFAFYRDLSAPDPYYILPILTGIAMLAQQKMTPSAGDPTQAKMMMIMPLMFGVFMIFLPLGLVLYIFVNALMTVIQQYMLQKNIHIIDLFRGKGRAAST